MRDGDIFCFQRDGDIHADRYPLSNVADYFRDLYNRFVVSFYDKNTPNDPGFMLTLNQRMGYVEVRKKCCKQKKKKVIPPGIEPGTLSVLDSRDNHYTTESPG